MMQISALLKSFKHLFQVILPFVNLNMAAALVVLEPTNVNGATPGDAADARWRHGMRQTDRRTSFIAGHSPRAHSLIMLSSVSITDQGSQPLY